MKMNEQAELIYGGVRSTARGQAVSADTSRVQWGPLICDYYPASRRFAWHLKGRGRDITKALTKPAVISLINIELEARA